MDEADRAAAREEQIRQDALASQKARAHLGEPADWQRLSAKWCVVPGCGERIPDGRRRALPGVQLCKDCSEDEEKWKRRLSR